MAGAANGGDVREDGGASVATAPGLDAMKAGDDIVRVCFKGIEIFGLGR